MEGGTGTANANGSLPSPGGSALTRARINGAYIDALDQRLSLRDREVAEAVARTRVMTSAQLECLVFFALAQPSRSVVRRRVLARLVSDRVLITLARRVGGVRAGSQGLTYALDTAGQLLTQRWHGASDSAPSRIRRPWTPGQLFLAHSLDVSELYVRLVEAVRLHGAFAVERFDAEPAAWVENGLGGWLKPDAYVVLVGRSFGECVFVEVDRATESLPTVRRKLLAYLDFMNRGQTGPDGVMPRVVITVPDARRQAAVVGLLGELGDLPPVLFTVVRFDRAVPFLAALCADGSA